MSDDLMRALLEQMREENNRRFSSMEIAVDKIAATLERFISLEQITQNQAHLIAAQSDSIITLTDRLSEVEKRTAIAKEIKAKSDRINVGIIVAAFTVACGAALKLLGIV